MTSLWGRVRELHARASDLPRAERRTFVERESADDPELRDEVLSLLDASTEGDGFLETPAIPALEGGFERGLLASSALPAGTRVGTYTLVRVIGTGGMGVVYEAEEESPRRRVALKMMRHGLVSESAVRRFHYEAEVLAGLRHPGIATIHATGVHEGTPWFAMELIDAARSLVEFADSKHLNLRDRIALFATACDAVHHGHMRGVIHRDLKAENLLVDGDSRVRVIDFGVARATDADPARETVNTLAGTVVGTLATMSPEQVSGAREGLDLRTDVYSLGVVLYQLLTGRLPHDVSRLPLPEAARAIIEDAPVRPGVLRAELVGDVETITLKALEKEPSRRYSSTAALAEDLRRFLASEPIQARPASMAYQLRLFARRNRALVAAVCIVTVVSVIAAGVSLRYAWAEQRAADDAERRFKIVRDVGSELLHDVLASLENVPGATGARAQVTETALTYLDALAAEVEDDWALLADLLDGYLLLGAFQGDPDTSGLGATEPAIASYERARRVAARLVALAEHGGEPDVRTREGSVRATLQLGRLYRRVGRTRAGTSLLLEAFAAAEEQSLPGLIADASISLGDVARAAGDPERARERFEDARRIYAEAGRLAEVARSNGRLGLLALDRQDFDEALRCERERRAAIEALLDAAPGDVGLRTDKVDVLADLARIEERRGDPGRSKRLADEALPIAQALSEADPSDVAARSRWAWLLDIRGAAERGLEDHPAAMASFGRSAELYERNLLVDPGDVEARVLAAESRTKAAGTLLWLGRAPEAVDPLLEAVETLEDVLAADPAAVERERVLAIALDLYGQALIVVGELELAAPVLERFREVSVSVAERSLDDSLAQRQLLLVHDRIGVLNQRRGEDKTRTQLERATSYRRAAEAYRDCLGVFDTLGERGFLYPGDEQAAPFVEAEAVRCDEAAAELESAAASESLE